MLGQTEQVAAIALCHKQGLHGEALDKLTSTPAGKTGERFDVGKVDLALARQVREDAGFMLR